MAEKCCYNEIVMNFIFILQGREDEDRRMVNKSHNIAQLGLTINPGLGKESWEIGYWTWDPTPSGYKAMTLNTIFSVI